MHLRFFLSIAILGLAASAQAQSPTPAVGSTVRLGDNPDRGDWPLTLLQRLYPQPSTGTESVTDRHAMTRSIEAMDRQTCKFTRQQVDGELGGQWPYVFRVLDLRDVPQQRKFTNGQVQSETHRWLQVVNQHRPQCTGWWDLGVAAASTAAAPAANKAPAPAPAVAAAQSQVAVAAGQPPGFACPVGWMPNPSGSLMRGGGFKCFASGNSSIPAGWQCPSGLVLKDHSATGLLICQAG